MAQDSQNWDMLFTEAASFDVSLADVNLAVSEIRDE